MSQSHFHQLHKKFKWQTASSLSLVLIAGIMAIATGAYFVIGQVYANKVFPGVSVLGIDLGGESYSDARFIINKSLSLGNIESLTLKHEDSTWEINPFEFGFKADVDMLVEEAMSIGRSGSLATNFNSRVLALSGQEQKAIVADSKAYSFDRPKLEDYLTLNVEPQINREVQEAKLIIRNGYATDFSPDQEGYALDLDESINTISASLLSPDNEVELSVEVQKPRTILAETNTQGINTLIARGESDFSGSPANRRHNIRVGAEKFDGVIVPSGEILSFIRELGPIDARAGYLPELVIKNDGTVPEFGGGLCQVSTTAFRAVLYGGLTITERRNHSYRVAYYEPAGTDATVYDPYPDFKFTNDTPGSILIDTYITGDKLFFDFYGTDTGRTVNVDGPHISNITAFPEPIYIDTSTLPPGEIKQIETPHRGATAVVYRKVYDANGGIVHNDTIKSHYIPWAAKYLRGVEDAAKVDTNLDNILPPENTATDPIAANSTQ